MRTELPQIKNFIDGQFVTSQRKYLDNIKPARAWLPLYQRRVGVKA